MRAPCSQAAAIAAGGYWVVTWYHPKPHPSFNQGHSHGSWAGELGNPMAETREDALFCARQRAAMCGHGEALVRREGETVQLSRIYAGRIGGFFHDQCEDVTDLFTTILPARAEVVV